MTRWDTFLSIARRLPREPRETTGEITQMDIPREALGPAFLSVIILSVVVTEPMLALAPMAFAEVPPPAMRALWTSLFSLALVWAIWRIGTGMGGRARFEHVLVVFILLELVFSVGIGSMLVLLLALPTLAGLVGLAFIGYWIWLFGVAISEVHGLGSAIKALLVVFLSWLMVYFGGFIVMLIFSGLFGGGG